MKTIKQAFSNIPKNKARIIIEHHGERTVYQTTGLTELHAIEAYMASFMASKRRRQPRPAMMDPQRPNAGAYAL